MSNKVRDNRTCYLFNNIINIENFDLNNMKIDQKSYKTILIHYIGYVTIKHLKYLQINIPSFIPYFQESEWIL